jgi:hypothetical protein
MSEIDSNNIILPDVVSTSSEPTIVPKDIADVKTTIDNVAYTIDKDGNAVDIDNKVIFTKQEIEDKNKTSNATTPTIEEEVEIDDIKYKLDDKGNALDKEGNIFKSKEELDKLSEVSDIPLIEDIQKKVGIVVTDDSGKAVAYSNDDEGLVKYISDAVAIRSEELYNNAASKFFQENPDILEIFKYKQLNGTIENYKPEEDYSKIEIKKDADNEEVQINLIIKERVAKGDTIEQANRFAQYSKTDGKLLEDAKAAQQYLITAKSLRDAEVNKQLESKRLAEEQSKQQELDNVYNKIIKDGKLTVKDKVYTLPKNIRVKVSDGKYETKSQEDFFNYLYQPAPIKLPNGQTINMTKHQYDIAIEQNSKTIDDDLLTAYLRFVGGDMTQIIEEQIKKAEVRKLKTIRSNSFGTTSKQLFDKTEVTDNIKLPVK